MYIKIHINIYVHIYNKKLKILMFSDDHHLNTRTSPSCHAYVVSCSTFLKMSWILWMFKTNVADNLAKFSNALWLEKTLWHVRPLRARSDGHSFTRFPVTILCTWSESANAENAIRFVVFSFTRWYSKSRGNNGCSDGRNGKNSANGHIPMVADVCSHLLTKQNRGKY